MRTTLEDIREWFQEGDSARHSHMMVMSDTFSHEYYPVYIAITEDINDAIKLRDGVDMQRIMEIYSYEKPFYEQAVVGKERVWNV